MKAVEIFRVLRNNFSVAQRSSLRAVIKTMQDLHCSTTGPDGLIQPKKKRREFNQFLLY